MSQQRWVYRWFTLIGLSIAWALVGCAWATDGEPDLTPTPVVMTAELKAGCEGAVYMHDYLNLSIEYLYDLTRPAPYVDEEAGIEAVLAMQNTGNGWLTSLTQMMISLLSEALNAESDEGLPHVISASSWTKAYLEDCDEMGAY